MIPLVGEVKELKFVKDVVVKVADELIAAAGVEMKYQVGTMIDRCSPFGLASERWRSGRIKEWKIQSSAAV